MTTRRLAISLLAAGAFVASPLAALAQSGAQSGAAQSPPVNCKVAPAGGNTDDSAVGSQPPPSTNRLDDCGSVLVPPVVGDAEMVEPAPDEGRTPVIDPSEVRPKLQ